MVVWELLGLKVLIKQALKIERAGELVLSNLLCLPEQQVQVLGLPKVKETVATAKVKQWQQRLGICGMNDAN